MIQPPLWPALLQVPREEYRGTKFPELDPSAAPSVDSTMDGSAPILFTGSNRTEAEALMQAVWSREISITDAAMAAYINAQATGDFDFSSSTDTLPLASESDFVDAAGALSRGLYEFGVIMGTSAFTSVTMLMEPAFVATSEASVRPPLYFAQFNCSGLDTEEMKTLKGIGEAITNMTGFKVSCASLPPLYVSLDELTNHVYCGWLNSGCIVRNGTRQYISSAESARASHPIQEFVSGLFDFRDTDSLSGRFNVAVWVNNTNVARDPGVPDIQRWSQPVNMAANAYLKRLVGPGASVRLAGVKDMPKGETMLSLDFSSLLGPLLMVWFMQMLLPINVYGIVYEKENQLRIMMRMQGLREGAYFAVQYMWMLWLYTLFMAIFVITGQVIRLKIFTLTSMGMQIIFYLIWGNVQAAFSLFLASWQREARPAVLLAVVYVIVTGLVADVVLVQFIERGPQTVSNIMEIIPAFGLFRVLYEFAQYAFLADRTGDTGLTWSKARMHMDCGFLRLCAIMILEWIIFLLLSYYLEQISGSGTGVKKHPLYFLPDLQCTGCRPAFGTRPIEMGVDRDTTQEGERKESSTVFSVSKWFSRLFTRNRVYQRLELRTEAVENLRKDGINVVGEQPDVQSPMEYYYGLGARDQATDSPQLDLDSLTSIARHTGLSSAGTPTDREGLFVHVRNSIVRKISSVKVFLESPRNSAEETDRALSHIEKEDVASERENVERIWQDWSRDRSKPFPRSILLHRLRKVYRSRHAEPMVAVDGISLSVEHSECFGLLGPNGAGKTTTMKMMEGFLDPTDGFAIIEGLSVDRDIELIYAMMGVCPQHNLLWDGLTGREHLLFYGRLKGLRGKQLNKSTDKILRRLNLQSVCNQLVSTYSGGMKRRLSVAISFIGDPLIVFLDEPSTGLDPSSRRLVWEVIKEARKKSSIVLTTHSMEEAEVLCDRLGIIMNGRLACIGDPKSLTARFGGYLSYTITTAPHQKASAAAMVRKMSPSARLVYALGGNQRYELPLTEVDVEMVFRRMEEIKLKGEIEVLDWGVSNATLEEVFIKIIRQFSFTQ